MDIIRLAPDDFWRFAKECDPFPKMPDKYLLFFMEDQPPLVLLAPKIIWSKDGYADIYHKNMKEAVVHRRYFINHCIERTIGGGSVDCYENTLLIHDYSARYGRAPQKVLNEIKGEILTFYQNLFPELKLTDVIARDGGKDDD
ncbi:MAG: hypothetical protein WA064_05270 [Candidatus Moraniibacteriota bacterium]